jgi:predicted nucleic acid-binding protein
MGYLIDTNVLSEVMKPTPAAPVLSWLASADPAECFLSALTIGELSDGALRNRRRGNTVRADRLDAWIALTEADYADRILPIDTAVAHAWAQLGADRTLPVVDSLLAATAKTHNLTIVTRNTGDFDGTDVPVHNPFEG